MKSQHVPAVSRYSFVVIINKSILLALVILAASMSLAQSQPNLENGFKHWGSYDFHNIDTVNTMNGNWMLNAPLLPFRSAAGGCDGAFVCVAAGAGVGCGDR